MEADGVRAWRRRLRSLRFHARVALGRGRLPNALIVGAAKSGTSSLYAWLAQHPGVCVPATKELRFFDNQWQRGRRWYAACFEPERGQSVVLEATPNYFPHPLAPERVRSLLPDARLIFLLREPVSRAYSHHQYRLARGEESLPFAEALASEEERLRGAEEVQRRGGVAKAFNLYNYLYTSTYAPLLERWLEHFPRAHILFLNADDLFDRPAETTGRVLDFLGLPRLQGLDLAPRNQLSYPKLADAEAAELQERFEASNRRVEELTGISWPERQALGVPAAGSATG